MDEPTEAAKPAQKKKARERTLDSIIESYLGERVRSGQLGRHAARNTRYALYRFAESYGARPVAGSAAPTSTAGSPREPTSAKRPAGAR